MAQLGTMGRILRASPLRWSLALLLAGLSAVVFANALAQVRLNAWHGGFYDAIEAKDLAGFGAQLLVFAGIACCLLVLVVTQTWLHETLKVRLRQWLTRDLLDQWLLPRRPFQLGLAGEIGAHPDQRIQEDARQLAELSADLCVGVLQASLMLVSFVGVLWALSSQVVLHVNGASFTLPGFMLWCAIGYALLGSGLTWVVGRPLIKLNADRYARDAAFRFALVRVADNAEGIGLHGGEAGERRALEDRFEPVAKVMQKIASGVARVTWITSGYGWLALVVPTLVAAPGYFGGSLSFGGMMMAVHAFFQVQQSLRWFVDHFPRIADWRATLLRVAALRETVATLGEPAGRRSRITIVDHPDGRLGLCDVSLRLPHGQAPLAAIDLEVAPGERVLLVGDFETGSNPLFQALAGLWPWGAGSIAMPPREHVMFVPQRPYFPLGTLRSAMTYPADPAAFDEEAAIAALERVGLDRLTTVLGQEARWDKDLPADHQHRLVLARILLHRPDWVILEDAVGAFADEHRDLMRGIFSRELGRAAVIGLARQPRPGFFNRVLDFRHRVEVEELTNAGRSNGPNRNVATPSLVAIRVAAGAHREAPQPLAATAASDPLYLPHHRSRRERLQRTKP